MASFEQRRMFIDNADFATTVEMALHELMADKLGASQPSTANKALFKLVRDDPKHWSLKVANLMLGMDAVPIKDGKVAFADDEAVKAAADGAVKLLVKLGS